MNSYAPDDPQEQINDPDPATEPAAATAPENQLFEDTPVFSADDPDTDPDIDPAQSDPEADPPDTPPEPEPEPEPQLTVSILYQEQSKTVIAVKRPNTDPFFTTHQDLELTDLHQKVTETIQLADRHWILNPTGNIHTKTKPPSKSSRKARTPTPQEIQPRSPNTPRLTASTTTGPPVAMPLFDLSIADPAGTDPEPTTQTAEGPQQSQPGNADPAQEAPETPDKVAL